MLRFGLANGAAFVFTQAQAAVFAGRNTIFLCVIARFEVGGVCTRDVVDFSVAVVVFSVTLFSFDFRGVGFAVRPKAIVTFFTVAACDSGVFPFAQSALT